jgi:hypothetical protein
MNNGKKGWMTPARAMWIGVIAIVVFGITFGFDI